MGNQRFNDLRRIFRRVGNGVQHAFRQSCGGNGFDDQRVGAWAKFRGLHDDGVAAGKRGGDGAHAENDRRVPRRHRQHDPCRLAERHGHGSRAVRWDDLALDLRGETGRLHQHIAGEHDVKTGPGFRRTDLLLHRLNDLRARRAQRLGSRKQVTAAFTGRGRGPFRESGSGSISRFRRIFNRRSGGTRYGIAGDRVIPFEALAVRGRAMIAADEKIYSLHMSPPVGRPSPQGLPPVMSEV
ncbi:hypothetical protein AGR8A_Lc10274 [Agrobacterium fabrum str. J-07]|nr:hypothetical protein AGR8A_Lc10274 [Agrobacterium fabrum str. J-07]